MGKRKKKEEILQSLEELEKDFEETIALVPDFLIKNILKAKVFHLLDFFRSCVKEMMFDDD